MIRSSTRYIKKRSYKIFDEDEFLDNIRNSSWWDVYRTDDVDEAVHLLTTKLNSILDTMAPGKTFQTNIKYCPWLGDVPKVLIQERNKAQEIASENKTDENLSRFKKLRNRVTNNLKQDKIKWKKGKLANCKGDSSKLWNNILAVF